MNNIGWIGFSQLLGWSLVLLKGCLSSLQSQSVLLNPSDAPDKSASSAISLSSRAFLDTTHVAGWICNKQYFRCEFTVSLRLSQCKLLLKKAVLPSPLQQS